jgi:hypothetical protein
VQFEAIPRYWLEWCVVDNGGGGHGRLDPNSLVVSDIVTHAFDAMTLQPRCQGGLVLENTLVTLTANPDPNYGVKEWAGTNNDPMPVGDPCRNTVNIPDFTTSVVGDAHVTVEFAAGAAISRLVGPIDVYTPNPANPPFGNFDSNHLTIQAAIDRASTLVPTWGPNTLVVVADGNYTGPGNVDLHFGGEGFRLRSEYGYERCIIDCNGSPSDPNRGFIFDGNEDPNLVVSGFTITNGYAVEGGGILFDGNGVAGTVENCLITGNVATNGGGLFFRDVPLYDPNVSAPSGPNAPNAPTVSGVILRDCKITDNNSTGDGGGIYCTGSSPWIIGCWITGNQAGDFNSTPPHPVYPPAYGGGFYCEAESEPEIINCLIADNNSTEIGGAFYLYESDAVITLCTIMNNWGFDMNDTFGPKGGVICRDSDPSISHCIIGRSGGWRGTWGGLNFGDDLYECTAEDSWVEENGDGDPGFVTGGLGIYYLNQTWLPGPTYVGGSPCVDYGVLYFLQGLEATYGLSIEITTDIWDHYDMGNADVGYHYPKFSGLTTLVTVCHLGPSSGSDRPNGL